MTAASTKEASRDVTRVTLTILFIAILLLGSFWVLRPFLFAFLWATLIVIPVWPIMMRMTASFGGRRGISVALLILGLLLLVVIPLWFAFSTIVEQREEVASWISTLSAQGMPALPSWVADVPLIGTRAADGWQELSQTSHQELFARVTPYLQLLLAWLVSQIGSASVLFVHFVLTLIFTAVLFLRGETFANGVRHFARRLGGERGEQATVLAAQALKAVAMGVVVTALLQAALSAVALAIVGIPHSVLLAAIIFFFAVVQIGAIPVLLPILGWLFWSGQTAWAIVFLIFCVLIGSIDNVVRPLLIQRGANLPLMLIFAGVIGGIISFGIIGLFVGPIILAVSYTLLVAWINEVPYAELSSKA